MRPRRNVYVTGSTPVAALLLAALSVSATIFLIMELDRPYQGLIHISGAPMRAALAQLGR